MVFNELKESKCYKNDIKLNVILQSYDYKGLSNAMNTYISDNYLQFEYNYFFTFDEFNTSLGSSVTNFIIKHRIWQYFVSKKPS